MSASFGARRALTKPEPATAWLKPRAWALAIDIVTVLAVAYLLTAVAYWATGGKVQGSPGPFTFTVCDQVSQLPALSPPPPVGANFAIKCTQSLGFPLATKLQIGKSERLGNTIRSEQQVYLLDASGRQVQSIFVVTMFHSFLILVFYLTISDWLTGASIGKRMMGLRTVDMNDPSEQGISFDKALVRNLVMQAGPLVLIAMFLASTWHPPLQAYAAKFFWGIIVLWTAYNMNWMMRRMHPTYDHLSGTTVVTNA